jgi:hypothetical protein
MTSRSDAADRLAAKLRENLARRKAQQRARRADADPKTVDRDAPDRSPSGRADPPARD